MRAFRRLPIANRGEIAIRSARAAADLDLATVAVYAEDDSGSAHVRRADASAAPAGSGPEHGNSKALGKDQDGPSTA